MTTINQIQHIDYPLVAEAHTPMYLMHKFWARKPHNVVAEYIKRYSDEGEIVLDPFAGSGVTAIEAIKLGRKGIAIDLDPIATFITRQTAIPADIDAIKSTFSNIQRACKEQIEALYETLCKRCGTKARILATVWDRDKKQPIEIRYYCPACDKRMTKQLDTNDEVLLKNIEKMQVDYWYPITRLYYNSKPFLKQEKVDSVDKLFTKRNLIALSIIYNEIDKITDPKMQDFLKFAFTSMVHLASKMCPVAKPSERAHWSEYSATSFWAVHSYWVPPKFMESNVWMLFDSAVNGAQGILRGKEDSNTQIKYYKEAKNFKDLKGKSNIFIKTYNALELSKIIPPNSVDYVFTDPPYGGAVQYFELSTLWCSWLKMNSDWWKDEITINEQQDKDFDYYHKMLHAAFLEIYKVLKPGRWMTVTFHSTDIKVYNSIIRAAVFAGFNLEKIIYQPPARASAKGLLQPYGSAVGDYYIRFRKPEKPKETTPPTEVDHERFEKVVVQIAKKIIAERGEPTAYTHILNGIYPELDRYGVLLSATGDLKNVLQRYVDKEFVLVDVTNEKGEVIGQKWWLKDPSEAKINLVPLHERVEKAVINVLNRKITATFDDIQQEIFIKFPNALTPEKESIRAVLQEYADPAGDGRWRLKPGVKERQRQHTRMIYYLAKLGIKAGYDIWIGTKEQGETYEGERLGGLSLKNLKLSVNLPQERLERIKAIDVLWLRQGEVVAAFEVENTTTITEAVIRVANIPYQIHKVILIPEERENLLARKIQEPGLQELGIKSWKFIFYDDLSKLYEKCKRRQKIAISDLLSLSRPLKYREFKQKTLDLFPGEKS
jgi:16S rRNA G966 N2-methylase RsmD